MATTPKDIGLLQVFVETVPSFNTMYSRTALRGIERHT